MTKKEATKEVYSKMDACEMVELIERIYADFEKEKQAIVDKILKDKSDLMGEIAGIVGGKS